MSALVDDLLRLASEADSPMDESRGRRWTAACQRAMRDAAALVQAVQAYHDEAPYQPGKERLTAALRTSAGEPPKDSATGLPRVIAKVQPQRWVRDQAVDAADAFEVDVTVEVSKLTGAERGALRDNSFESDDLYLSAVDAGRAQRWEGPFYVVVRDAIDRAYGAGRRRPARVR